MRLLFPGNKTLFILFAGLKIEASTKVLCTYNSFCMCLTSIIRDKIQQEGPVSFHDFMEMALYHPEEGYYTSGREKLGKQGDYYTSAYLTSCFGKLIAKQMEEMWNVLGRQPFTIVEYGAGSGLLCKDI